MKADTSRPLPGLERLTGTCRRLGLPVKLPPPIPAAPREGESVLGQPIDPLLAAVYQRLGDATFGDFFIERPDPSDPDGLYQWNEWVKRRNEEPFRSCLLFAKTPGLAYFYAVVPRLADARGRQPVLYIDNHDERVVLPIASDVDRFFDTYSRYLEALVQAPDYTPGEFWALSFPWSVPELIARDRPLVELLMAGRFEGLMTTATAEREWLQQVKSARP
jgi:hypothetical protein